MNLFKCPAVLSMLYFCTQMETISLICANIRTIGHAGTTLIIMAALWRVRRPTLQRDQSNQCWFMMTSIRGDTPNTS